MGQSGITWAMRSGKDIAERPGQGWEGSRGVGLHLCCSVLMELINSDIFLSAVLDETHLIIFVIHYYQPEIRSECMQFRTALAFYRFSVLLTYAPIPWEGLFIRDLKISQIIRKLFSLFGNRYVSYNLQLSLTKAVNVLPQLVMENASVKLNTIAGRFFYGKESEAVFG